MSIRVINEELFGRVLLVEWSDGYSVACTVGRCINVAGSGIVLSASWEKDRGESTGAMEAWIPANTIISIKELA